ncbi:hypothetical protein MUN81_05220 [Hymenobacter sp. 5317J-9]|uniref:hypothetical protein n=1 Tax=Hymenobacter sp. 5317J-9 TaxID=2932250 RepID=UPI001FD65F7F|nr:hypothetical protein [Hymenobacter sp. 5317J-9]UOQ98890.1 hypothetical protein MUN81_05220 [Hymenobacter sp. 5317J-9]
MNPNKPNSLENFVDRHRADFDAHEPRPDLWAALEQQLGQPLAPPALHLAEEPLAPQASAAPASWLQRYGVAASLALLVFAAGASEAWKSNPPSPAVAAVATPQTSTSASAESDAALYQGGNPTALAAAERTTGADSQLVRAVRGMEAYYTNQLARRQSELTEMRGPGTAGMTADWQRELVSLDSSYRQLKAELLHHPQPDAVLTAMNRNLQVRLDILDQQLHLGTSAAEDRSAGSYVLADSRHDSE